MFNFLLEAVDLWTDAPRTLKAWACGLGFAAVIVVAGFAVDRCTAERPDAPPKADAPPEAQPPA